jgi:NADPH-dependent 2,4-dienoyl-CoA reductase/sulfur reductase-like enzyme
MEPNTSSRKRVLIVGGGFAGLNAAKVFHDVDCAVTVIDRNNYHTFQPLLYESFLWSSGHHICGNAMLFSAWSPFAEEESAVYVKLLKFRRSEFPKIPVVLIS